MERGKLVAHPVLRNIPGLAWIAASIALGTRVLFGVPVLVMFVVWMVLLVVVVPLVVLVRRTADSKRR